MGGDHSYYGQWLRFITFTPVQSQNKHGRDWCVAVENPLFILLMFTQDKLSMWEWDINAEQWFDEIVCTNVTFEIFKGNRFLMQDYRPQLIRNVCNVISFVCWWIISLEIISCSFDCRHCTRFRKAGNVLYIKLFHEHENCDINVILKVILSTFCQCLLKSTPIKANSTL